MRIDEDKVNQAGSTVEPPWSDAPAHHYACIKRRSIRRLLEAHILLPIFAAVLLVIGWTIVVHLVNVERISAETAAAELSRELADTYEAQMVRNLAGIDHTLKTIKYAYELKNGVRFDDLQDHGLLPSAMVFEVAVADRNGRVLASTRPHAPTSVATEPYFVVQRDRSEDSSTPFISEAATHPTGGRDADATNASDGASVITFSRRLRNRQGHFAGVVMVSVDSAYFTSGYDFARMGSHGLLMLAGMDGRVRAEQTGEHIASGRALPSNVLHDLSANFSSDAAVAPWDRGVIRYTNVRPLPAYGLVAIVGLCQNEQLAQFRSYRKSNYFWAALGSAIVILLTFMLSRSSWQLSMSRRRARRAQQTYYAASEASTDAFFVFRGQLGAHGALIGFVLLDTNRRGSEILALPRERLIGRTLAAVFPRAFADGMFDELASVARSGKIREHEWVHERADGHRAWLYRQVVPVEDGIVVIARDISSRKRAEDLRTEQNRVLEMIATSTPLEEVLTHIMSLLESQIPTALCAALLPDESAHFLKLGAAPGLPEAYREFIAEMRIELGLSPSGRAMHVRQPVYINDIPTEGRFYENLIRMGLSEIRSCWALPILSQDGTALGTVTLYLKVPQAPSPNDIQAIDMATRIAGIAIDRHLAEERIRHMANHDTLTGLPNRSLLSDRLNQALLQAQRYQRGVTIIFIDLDHFKLINDSLGHRSGDELLKTVAERMVRAVRRTDTVVRLGGDEFVIVLFDQDQSGAGIAAIVEKIRDAVIQPIALDSHSYQVTCSMGLASYPNDGTDADSLLMNADAAMYRAKELGRDNYQIYTAEMNVKVHEKLRVQEQLRHALENGEFKLVYQPQVDLETQRIFGVEALLRWHHPGEGVVSPATFIPIAEETGLILPMGDWVLHEACRQNKAWQEQGLPPLAISVNVSARQFLQQELVAQVDRALQISGLEAKYLELEITESVIMQDLDGAISTMRDLQAMGVSLSIDDFGTGYSSLSALKHFPIGRLKIDKSFVRELPGGQDDRAIAMAIISLGRQLNLKVIAEGVETSQQLQFLYDNQCTEIQGYHFSKPLYPADLEALLRAPFFCPGLVSPAEAPPARRKKTDPMAIESSRNAEAIKAISAITAIY